MMQLRLGETPCSSRKSDAVEYFAWGHLIHWSSLGQESQHQLGLNLVQFVLILAPGGFLDDFVEVLLSH